MDQHRRHAGHREPLGHRAGGLQAQENSGKMNRKQLAILIVLGAAIGALGLYVSRRNAASYQSSGEGGAGKKLLPDFPINDVARIDVKQDTNELNLVRQDDSWTVRERYGYPANFQEIGDFLRKMWDLKVVQTEQIGPSQLSRFELSEESNGTNAAIRVEFKDKADKTIKAVALGKKHLRKSDSPSPFGGADGFPDGRYVRVAGGSKDVAVVSDALSEVETKPDRWLNKDFFKVEKLKSIALTHTNATNSWKLTRETENGPLSLADAKPGEQLDAGKSSPAGNALSFPGFSDVVSPETKPEDMGMDKPIVAKIETFDGFTYTLRIGTKTNQDNYYLRMSVAGDFPRERAPGKDEKPEDKEKLDKEFKDNASKLEEKLKQEKAFEKWTYLVSKWTVDPLLKERKDLLAEKKEEPKKEEKPAATNTTTQPKITPPPVPALEPKKENKPAEKKPDSDQ
ncbi:MAG: hypothetical protein DME18_02265 [Verrucomicrobia bacterium]|nr:MAG: hypothetical protein DME18_02265 [Verrucomicrobiota bacterium]